MKNVIPASTSRRLIGAGLLAAALVVSVGQNTLAAQPAPDPTHAAHVAAGIMPPNAAIGDPVLAQQLSELQAKVAQLEATLAQHPAPMASTAATAMPGMPATAAAPPPMSMGMDKMKPGHGQHEPGRCPGTTDGRNERCRRACGWNDGHDESDDGDDGQNDVHARWRTHAEQW